MENETVVELLTNTCLLAGKIMMESGAEVYRVEDTLARIAVNTGYDAEVYVTVTGVFFSLRACKNTEFINIHKRSINLEKVANINQYSRMYAQKQISLYEFYQFLEEMAQQPKIFSLGYQLLAAGLVSNTLMILFGGIWFDFLPTFIIGIIGYLVSYLISLKIKTSYFDHFFGALSIGLLTVLFTSLGWAYNKDLIILGAVMPLVPGVAITNSFRDILSGHLLSGLARGTEALIIAGAIGLGIALGLSFG